MNYYIQVDSANAFIGHPIEANNLKQVFPDHDFISGPPTGYLEFERVEEPELKPYEKFDNSKGLETSDGFSHNGLEYKLIDGKYKDVWNIINITDEEKQAKQDRAKEFFANGPYKNCSSWVWDEEQCAVVAPVPYPDVAIGNFDQYEWNEETLNWDKI
jgi:hypothetical protein